MPSLVHRLALPLALAVLIEVLSLRLLMRIGAFLPRADQLLDFYRGLMLLGTAAANLASLLAMGTLVLFGLMVARRGRLGWLASLIPVTAAGYQLWLALAPSTEPLAAVLALLLVALAVAVTFILGWPGGWSRVGTLAMLAAYLAAAYFAVAQPARALGLELPGAIAAFWAAEALAVVAALGAPWLVPGGLRRGPAIAAGGVGLLTLVALTFAPSTSGMAIIWTIAFSLYLPAPLYALAAGCFVYALIALWRQPGRPAMAAAGLVLIALGGLKLDYGYFALLAMAGFVLVIDAVGLAQVPATAPTPLAVPAETGQATPVEAEPSAPVVAGHRKGVWV